ncbi:hypothetical protein U1Q18_025614 [Sarracenia purpurea var. burkii]
MEKDPKPLRSDKDVIEEALCIHSNLEVILHRKSMDAKLDEVFSVREENQVKSASRMRRNVLPVSWANVVKREGHALKPRSASRLEFIAPKDPGRPEVIEIEDRGLSSLGPRVLLGQLFKLSFLLGLFPNIA